MLIFPLSNMKRIVKDQGNTRDDFTCYADIRSRRVVRYG